jgi:hypothetical protein
MQLYRMHIEGVLRVTLCLLVQKMDYFRLQAFRYTVPTRLQPLYVLTRKLFTRAYNSGVELEDLCGNPAPQDSHSLRLHLGYRDTLLTGRALVVEDRSVSKMDARRGCRS